MMNSIRQVAGCLTMGWNMLMVSLILLGRSRYLLLFSQALLSSLKMLTFKADGSLWQA